MSGYIEAGYVIVLGSLALYAASVVTRERAARRRVSRTARRAGPGNPSLPSLERVPQDDPTRGSEQ